MKIFFLGVSLFIGSLFNPILAEDFNNDGWTIVEEDTSEEEDDNGWTIVEEESSLPVTPKLEEKSVPSIKPSLAEKSNDFYMSIGGGKAFTSNREGDTSFLIGPTDLEFHQNDPFIYSLAFGKKFGEYRIEFNYLAGEIEADELSAERFGLKLTSSISPTLKTNFDSFMVYGYKDFPNESNFTPYLGLGAGIGRFEGEDQIVTIAGIPGLWSTPGTSVFSYALKGGVDYALNDKTALYSEATYQDFGSFNLSKPGFIPIDYDSTNYFGISAGIRFFF